MSGIWSSISLSFTNRVQIVEYDYNENALSLERCESIKGLGVIVVDKKLNWNAHIYC